MSRKKHNPNPAGKEGAPVSLYPLSFKEAIAGLAQVQMPEREKPKAKTARGGLAKIRRSAKP
jgi:hypothetical protein